MSLGDIVSADRAAPVTPSVSVIEDLRAAMSSRPPDFRAEGWHPSQLIDMCPRFEILKQLMPDAEGLAETPNDPRTLMIFDVGTALHAWWQEQYFGPMGVLKGNWRCRQCGHTVQMDLMPILPHDCVKGAGLRPTAVGNNKWWTFTEVPVKSPEWGITGHSDGIYLLGKRTPLEIEAILEMKTAGPSFWDRGGIPYAANIFQINIYMWLTGKKKGVLLYIDKGGVNKDLPLMCKEIIVDYNDAHRKDACAKIELYRDAVTSKKLPPRMALCELKPHSAKPSNCPLSRICLSDQKSDVAEKAWGVVKMR